MVHEFRLLRNRIEAEIHAPALLLVTSATSDDGAGFTAYGLAESLGKTNQRTVLVTLDSSLSTPVSGLAPEPVYRRRATDPVTERPRPARAGSFSVVTISQERLSTISRTSVAELVNELRSENDFVVIDAGHLPTNSFGLLLVTLADAVLVAFRSGRVQQAADQLMLDMLERAESKILGVVMTDQVAIDHFNHRNDPLDPVKRVSERRSVSLLAKRLEVALSRLGRMS
jgi:Mrp family chromosome partitioning ATPase